MSLSGKTSCLDRSAVWANQIEATIIIQHSLLANGAKASRLVNALRFLSSPVLFTCFNRRILWLSHNTYLLSLFQQIIPINR